MFLGVFNPFSVALLKMIKCYLTRLLALLRRAAGPMIPSTSECFCAFFQSTRRVFLGFGRTLFSSAIDILAAIKASFQRCSAISTGQPLLDIVAVFQRILTAYVNALTAQCVSSK